MRRILPILTIVIAAMVVVYLVVLFVPGRIAIMSISRTEDLSGLSAFDREHWDDWRIYDVRISAGAAGQIGWREAYVSVVLSDCENPKSFYPAMTDLDFPAMRKSAREGKDVSLRAHVPAEVASRLSLTCVHLRGGSYLMGSVESPTISLPR